MEFFTLARGPAKHHASQKRCAYALMTPWRGAIGSAPAFRPEVRASPGQALATLPGGAEGGRAIRFRGGRPSIIRVTSTCVRGNVHTNSIDSFWSLLKRGVIGTYQNVSKEYLPLDLNEFRFRFNNRNAEDIFGVAIGGC